MFSDRSDIEYELRRLNDRLRDYDLHLDVTLVGGAALIMNRVYSISTEDIDTISKISQQIQELLDDLSIDINDDAIDYIDNYRNHEFIPDDDMSMSNISIEYLDLPGVVLTKMQNVDDFDKVDALAEMLAEGFDVDMTVSGIESFLDRYGYACDSEDQRIIEEFLNAYDSII